MLEVLYKRIKEMRKKNNMTQEELAKKMGYTSRSTIAKIESGACDITRSRIIDFANSLNCSPSYLMGWTDDPAPAEHGVKETVTHVLFTESGNFEAVRFPDAIIESDGNILDLRSLSREEQNDIIDYMKYVLSKKDRS